MEDLFQLSSHTNSMSFAILLCVSGSREVVCREWFYYHHKCYVDTAICPFLNGTGVPIATGAGTQDITQVLVLYQSSAGEWTIKIPPNKGIN